MEEVMPTESCDDSVKKDILDVEVDVEQLMPEEGLN